MNREERYMKKRKFQKLASIMLIISMLLTMIPANIKNVHATNEKINIGDYIYLGTYQGKHLKWRCIGKDANGTLMVSDSILCKKSYDATYSGYNNSVRKNSGSNYWKGSTLRKWLNSSGKIDWSQRSEPSKNNLIEGKENHYEDEQGFLTLFSDAELQCIKKTTQKTYLNNLDSEYKDGGTKKFDFDANDKSYVTLFNHLSSTGDKWYQNTTDKVFILGPEQFKMACDNLGEDYMSKAGSYWLRLPCNTGMSYENIAVANKQKKGTIGYAKAANGGIGVRAAFYFNEDEYYGEVVPGQVYFKLGEDSNRFENTAMSYMITDPEYTKRLLNACDTFESQVRIIESMKQRTGGICHGITISMCYGDTGYINFDNIRNGATNYWTLGSPQENEKMRNMILYYHLTQYSRSGIPTYNVNKEGWEDQTTLQSRLSKFLWYFVQEAKNAQSQAKPFIFTYLEGKMGHSVVVCGYQQKEDGRHEIKIYDENSYSSGDPGDFLTMKISSDCTSFDFTDANGIVDKEKLQDHWTCLRYYGMDKLYNGGIDILKSRSSLKLQAVEAADTEKTTIQIPVGKKFRIQNAEGKYLEYDGTNYTGDMKVWDSYMINLENDPIWNLTVDASDSFELTKADQGCQFVCSSGKNGYAVTADGADQVKIQSGKIEIQGSSYKLSTYVQSKNSSNEIRKISADVQGNSTIIDDAKDTTIKFEGEGKNLELSKFTDFKESVVDKKEDPKPATTTEKKNPTTQTVTKLKKQTITTAKIKTYKAKNLKKKKVSFYLKTKVKGKAKITYKVVKYPKNAKKYISVTKKGKVTLNKKAKKGIYKIRITANKTSKYQKAVKNITIKVK